MELLVATAVMALLFALVLGLTVQVGGIWRAADGQKARRKDARALLETISSDLRAAVLPLDPAAQDNLQFLLNPPTVVRFRNRDCAFWQAALPRQGAQSDVVMVGYFVRWEAASDPADPARPVASLCRLCLPASDPNYAIYRTGTGHAWVDDALLDTVAPGTVRPGPTRYQGLMAENVVGLWISLWDGSGNPVTGAGAEAAYDSRRTEALPAVAEVALAIVNPAAAAQLTRNDAAALSALEQSGASVDAFAAACAGGNLAKVGRGLQVFRTRVALGQGGTP